MIKNIFTNKDKIVDLFNKKQLNKNILAYFEMQNKLEYSLGKLFFLKEEVSNPSGYINDEIIGNYKIDIDIFDTSINSIYSDLTNPQQGTLLNFIITSFIKKNKATSNKNKEIIKKLANEKNSLYKISQLMKTNKYLKLDDKESILSYFSSKKDEIETDLKLFYTSFKEVFNLNLLSLPYLFLETISKDEFIEELNNNFDFDDSFLETIQSLKKYYQIKCFYVKSLQLQNKYNDKEISTPYYDALKSLKSYEKDLNKYDKQNQLIKKLESKNNILNKINNKWNFVLDKKLNYFKEKLLKFEHLLKERLLFDEEIVDFAPEKSYNLNHIMFELALIKQIKLENKETFNLKNKVGE